MFLSLSIDTAPNESCEREAERNDPYRPQEMATQAHQAFR